MYTYKDLKKSVLQKLGEARNTAGENITLNTNINDYITAIPHLLNEALQYCATAGRFIVKTLMITQDGTDTGKYIRHDLRTLAPDFYSLYDKEVYFEDTDGYVTASNYAIEGDKYFVTDPATAGTWTIYYNSYPQNVVDITDETEIDVADEVFALLAYHITGELLLANDEDYAIERKSEFEQRRAELMQRPLKQAQARVIVDDVRRLF